MFYNNLPAIIVLLPLMGAFLCVLINNVRGTYILSGIILTAMLVTNSCAFLQLDGLDVVKYYYGGWLPPFGIEYRITHLNIIFLILINIIAFLTYVASMGVRSHSLFMLIIAGFNGMLMANDIFNIYVFLEISSLATYSFLAISSNKKSLIASFDYLIIGTIAASFYLMGVGFLYAYCGTLNISDMQNILPKYYGNPMVICGAIFILGGLALKSALFPLHLWIVKCYVNTSGFASSFLSGTATKVMIYLIIRLYYTILQPIIDISFMLQILALFAIIIIGIWVFFCSNFKQLLAVSSVTNILYIFIAFSLDTEIAIVILIISVISHSLAKSPLFIIANITGTNNPFTGNKWIDASTVINTLSLIGMPLTAGFVAKVMLIYGLIISQKWLLLIAVLFSSLMMIYVFFRVYHDNHSKVKEVIKIDYASSGVLYSAAIINILIAVSFGVIIQYAHNIAKIVINGGL
jgi:multicomponent Na+:H+ antiporter subunit D